MLNQHMDWQRAPPSPTPKLLGDVWSVAAALLIAFAWLLPNHYMPWVAFHADALMATGLLLVASGVLFASLKESSEWQWLTFVVAIISLIPIFQYMTGMIPFWGVAWINCAYLTGFLLALLVGERWERLASGQCLDVLFLAVGIGGLVSMYLAMHQLLRIDSLELWVMQTDSSRPGANLGQPNQLATLFVLGMLASSWGYYRRHLSGVTATFLAGFFSLGVAITQSRTGWLNVTILLVLMQVWARRLASRHFTIASSGLAVFFITSIIGITPLVDWLLSEHSVFFDGRLEVGARPLAWKLFWDALKLQPIWGFGWGQGVFAHFQMAIDHPYLRVIFFQSHNLFLDLALWNGIPIALAIISPLLWWSFVALSRIKNLGDLLCGLFLLVFGIHAMLEYPLHYAYFLLPFGLVAGVASVKLRFTPAAILPGWVTVALLLICTSILVVTVRDYMLVETSFNALRFEKARVGNAKNGQPPDVLVLTQLRDMIRFARVDPYAKFQPNELNWMRQIVQAMPSSYVMQKLSTALAINGEPKEAYLWMERLCRMSPMDQCINAQETWKVQASKYAAVAAVRWPAK